MTIIKKWLKDAVKDILHHHNERKNALKVLDDTITGLCHVVVLNDVKITSGSDSSEPERVFSAKESNREYQRLKEQVDTVNHALNRLRKNERDIVIYMYVDGYSGREVAQMVYMSERRLWQIEPRAITKISHEIFTLWSESSR